MGEVQRQKEMARKVSAMQSLRTAMSPDGYSKASRETVLGMMVAFLAKSVLGRVARSTKRIPGVSCVLWDDQTVSEVLHPQWYHHSSLYRMNIHWLRMM